MQENGVIIIGAGPAGLATAASLNIASIPNIILERDDCYAPMWKKKAYDRLQLHLAKQSCQLPHMPFPPAFPKYVPNRQFVEYLDDYVAHFNIRPLCRRTVELAEYNEVAGKWHVKAKNGGTGEVEEYFARFLVVATGENCDPFIPEIEGLSGFSGDVLHSIQYKNGTEYKGKQVLVVGSGNSGVEVAVDLANFGAITSIVIRSPFHLVNREILHFGVILFRYISFKLVDSLMVILSKLRYGDLSKYGIRRPTDGGPFTQFRKYGKYPVFDVGIYSKIKSREIQVLPAVRSIRGNEVQFENGKSHSFDVIIFATGFKRSTNQWLKGDNYLLNDDGFAKQSFPNHWKGKNGLYCMGLAKGGLFGIQKDAITVAEDIKKNLSI